MPPVKLSFNKVSLRTSKSWNAFDLFETSPPTNVGSLTKTNPKRMIEKRAEMDKRDPTIITFQENISWL